MEYMQLWYRIFHEDLQPHIFQKSRVFYEANLDLIMVEEVAHPYNTLPLAALKYRYYEQLFREFSCTYKKWLHDITFDPFFTEDKTLQTIRKHQRCFTDHKTKIINEYVTEKDTIQIYELSREKNSNADIFKLIYQTLDEIVLHLEDKFYTYLDRTLPISHQRQLWFFATYKDQIDNLCHHLETESYPEQLQQLVLTSLEAVRHPNPRQPIDYEQYEYYKAYVDSLWNWMREAKKKPEIEALQHTLITNNYNTIRTCYYICNKIKVHINSLTDYHEKLEVLYQYRKQYKTLWTLTQSAYTPKLPSLKEQVLLCIEEEIEYLLRNKHLESYQNSTAVIPTKQVLHMSVAELSALIKVLHQNKFIQEPIHQVFQKIPQIISTPNTENISPESLRKNYYAISKNAQKTLKRKLALLLSHLE